MTTQTKESTEENAPHSADVEATGAQKFTTNTDTAAEWYLGKLANIEAEKARVKAQAEKIVKQLDADAESLRFLYGAELETYVKAKLAATGNRRRSIHFLQGSCAFRTVPSRLTLTDARAALEWAREAAPDLIENAPTLLTAQFRKLAEARAEETGELLPGVEMTEARESFSVTYGKSEE